MASATDCTEVGEHIALWQHRHRVPCNALARYLGVHRSTLTRWKRGEHVLSGRLLLYRLAEVEKRWDDLRGKDPVEKLEHLTMLEGRNLLRYTKKHEAALTRWKRVLADPRMSRISRL